MSNLTSYGDLVKSNIKTANDCNNKCSLSGFTLTLFHNIDGCMCAEEEVLRGSYKQWNAEGKCEGKYLFTVYRTDGVMMGDEGTQSDLTSKQIIRPETSLSITGRLSVCLLVCLCACQSIYQSVCPQTKKLLTYFRTN